MYNSFSSASSSNSSDDEPLFEAAKHPQVTKLMRIIVERCDLEEAGDIGGLHKTSPGTYYMIKSLYMLL